MRFESKTQTSATKRKGAPRSESLCLNFQIYFSFYNGLWVVDYVSCFYIGFSILFYSILFLFLSFCSPQTDSRDGIVCGGKIER